MNRCFPITKNRNLQSSELGRSVKKRSSWIILATSRDAGQVRDPYVRWCERRTVSLWLTAVYSIVGSAFYVSVVAFKNIFQNSPISFVKIFSFVIYLS